MSPHTHHSAPAAETGGRTAAGDDAREVEWQLAAPDLGAVRRWLEQHSVLEGFSIEPLPAQQLHDTYLDTEDWRVLRAGFALRLRDRDGRAEATLKGLRSARESVADRREISEPLPDAAAKALARATGPVGRRVRDVAGVKRLRTLFEVRNSRQRFAIRSRDSAAAVGEIALDEAQFPRADGNRRPMVLTRVELEASGADPAPLERLAQRLRTGCGLRPATENKFVVGLRSASLDPPRLEDPGRKAEPVQAAVGAPMRASELAAAALRRLLEEWAAREPAARLGEIPEALHALRVTGRRMDVVLSLFGACLPTSVSTSRPRLKSLLDALGGVRDVDIRLEGARSFRDSLPEGDRGTLDPLLRHLESERETARSAMLRALDARATREWLETLPAQLTRGTPRKTAATSRDVRALAAVPDLMRRRYRKLRKCVRRLTPDSPLREYHKVRVRAKKLRYGLEIVAPTYGKPADEMLAALHKLQSKLGSQHDAGAMAGYLTQLAGRPPASLGAPTLFMMGRMAELSAREAGRLGRRIGKAWRKVSGKRWKALRARMRTLREEAPERSDGGNGIDHDAVRGPRPHPGTSAA